MLAHISFFLLALSNSLWVSKGEERTARKPGQKEVRKLQGERVDVCRVGVVLEDGGRDTQNRCASIAIPRRSDPYRRETHFEERRAILSRLVEYLPNKELKIWHCCFLTDSKRSFGDANN